MTVVDAGAHGKEPMCRPLARSPAVLREGVTGLADSLSEVGER